MADTLKTRLKKLSLNQKFILTGSFLAVVSTILPWYRDLDKFNTGDSFLGITGPLYLAGLIVLLASAASFSLIAMRLFDRPLPKLPLSEKHFHIFTGCLSIFMIVMTASVYFHPKFGINLTEKTAGIGMILALIGSGLELLGTILREKVQNFHSDGHLDALISMTHTDRMGSIREPEVDQGEVKVAVNESLEEFINKDYDYRK